MYSTIISAQNLLTHHANPNWVIVDCRFSLASLTAGPDMYATGHVPGAVYAHLDNDLSGPPLTDAGRHPLPSADALRALFGRLGIDSSKQVVCYDQVGGALAARLWWMLHYMGHAAAAVLDGGWAAWEALDGPTQTGSESNAPATFVGNPNRNMLVLKDEVTSRPLLIDSRAGERYAGLTEHLDPLAGHIPNAINRHFALNMDADKRMRSAEELQAHFMAAFGAVSAEEATFYCGSGVTACHNILATRHAGFAMPKLYVGSWSEWSRDETTDKVLGTP